VNLQDWFHAASQRVEKNTRLLTAPLSIWEGKQTLAENHGIARLSVLAMIFLPVAAILVMQGSFAHGVGNLVFLSCGYWTDYFGGGILVV